LFDRPDLRASRARRGGPRSLVIRNGGVIIVGSLHRGVIFDDFHPDRDDIAGAIACLIGIAVIMYAPR
jgi:drug/metabolite transporter superfamily protein YnfA